MISTLLIALRLFLLESYVILWVTSERQTVIRILRGSLNKRFLSCSPIGKFIFVKTLIDHGWGTWKFFLTRWNFTGEVGVWAGWDITSALQWYFKVIKVSWFGVELVLCCFLWLFFEVESLLLLPLFLINFLLYKFLLVVRTHILRVWILYKSIGNSFLPSAWRCDDRPRRWPCDCRIK